MTHGRKPPPLMPEVLPLVSPRPKAPYAMGLRPSVLTYDPVRAGRLSTEKTTLSTLSVCPLKLRRNTPPFSRSHKRSGAPALYWL